MNDEERNMSGEEPTEPQPSETEPTAEQPTEPQPTSAEEPTEQPPSGGPRPNRLLRSTSDRMIWGVAGGLGRYFGIDPIIFRIGFAISIFLGGLGLLAYVALALFVPAGDGDDVQPAPYHRSRWIGVALGIALALILLPPLAFGAVYVTATGNGIWAAVLIAILGVILLVTGMRGGARWLIIPAVVLAAVVGGTAAADIRFPSSIGEREYRPAEASSIPEEGYELGLGRLLVDLRNIDWEDNQVVNLDIDVGFGQADIVVPESVCVAADAHAGAGELLITGERSDGIDVDSNRYLGTAATPLLVVNAEIDAGQIRVINDDDTELGDHHSGRWDDDDALADQRAAAELACAEPEPNDSETGKPTETERGKARR